MFALVVALQAAGVPVAPPAPVAPPGPPAPYTTAPPPPHTYPVPSTWGPPVPPASWPPPPEPPRRHVHGFARLDLGVGSDGFAPSNSLLRELGYGAPRAWASLDGAYMFHPRVGAGVWLAMSQRRAAPENALELQELVYAIAAQAPVLLYGQRRFALHVVPRIGYAAGKLETGRIVDAPFQHAVIWGGALTATSFVYHVGGSIALMRAQTGGPGGLEFDHDYGGLYFAIGGTVDG